MNCETISPTHGDTLNDRIHQLEFKDKQMNAQTPKKIDLI